MNNLFIINEEERNRILNLHETATKRHYLKKTIEEVLLREDDESLPEMKTVPLGKVEAVQQALINAGYNIGPTGVDGVFGKNTRSAVLKYQKDNGIKQTGNVGPKTAERLGVQQLTSIKPSQPQTTTTTVPGKEKSKVTPITNVIGKDKFKLEPEVYTVAKDNTRVGNGRKMKIPDIKTILNDVGQSKKSSLPLHIRAVWDYLMGRTEAFTSADLTKEEQKYVKQVAMNNPNKGFTYGIWKASGASNLPTAPSKGSASEKERLKQSGGSGSLINSPLAGQFMYFLGQVSPPNVKISPDKKRVTIKDNYDMNNSKIPKDKIIKDFAKQVGKFSLGDATLYSVIRQTVGLKELAGYKGYPVNLDV